MSISAACRWCARRPPAAPMRASPRAVFRCSSPDARSGTPAPRSGRSFSTPPSDRLGVATDALDDQRRHHLRSRQCQTSYWELADDVSLDREATPGAVPKTSTQRALAGNSVQRLDIPDKVFGAAALHSRFRAAGHAAWPRAAIGNIRRETDELKEDAARAVAGLVAIVRDGNFAGVVSETEDGAEAALKALRKGATWSAGETLPDEDGLAEWLKAQPAESTVIDKQDGRVGRLKRRARSGGNIPAPISRTARSRRPAPWRNGAAIASTSGPTARASICCAPISRWCSNCRSRTSRSSTWKAPAATGTTPPTTSRSMRCCWRKRPADGRSACNGRAPTR